jgi:carotenoid cleavage dioxygenase
MMHDLAITENYLIFPLAPVVMDLELLMSGRPYAEALRWAPELGMKFGVKRREAGSPVRWLDVPTTGFIFHPGNAYEVGGKIVMDACTYQDPTALLESLKTWRSGVVRPGFHAVPFLYEIDLAAGKVSERQLDDRACEFPRCDDRLVGHENRYGYALRSRAGKDATSEPWSVLVRYDRKGGPTTSYDFGRGHWPSEPVFVPRSAQSAEDDGFVVATVYDGPEDSTYLAVLDAANLGAGPIGMGKLEHRIPLGFHGNFATGVI